MRRGGEIRIGILWENMNRPLTNPGATMDDKLRVNIKKLDKMITIDFTSGKGPVVGLSRDY
jgi:hypothetical protein